MYFRKVATNIYVFMWITTTLIGVFHSSITNDLPLMCRPDALNCHVRNLSNFGFDLYGNNSLEVTIYNNSIELVFDYKLTDLDDINVPFFTNEMRTITVDIKDAIPPKKSYKVALQLLNIVYFEKLELYFEKFDSAVDLDLHHFEGLTDLKSLKIEGHYNVMNTALNLDLLRPLEDLKDLYLINMIVPPIPDFCHLTKIVINRGSFYERLQPFGECGNVEILEISGLDVRQLPDAWLSHCKKLRTVALEQLRYLHKIPNRMLQGVHTLHSLSVKKCSANEVPKDLITYTPSLQKFELSSIWIPKIPSGFFSNSPNLQELILGTLPIDYIPEDKLHDVLFLKLALLLNEIRKYSVCTEDIRTRKEDMDLTVSLAAIPKLENLTLINSDSDKLCPEWNNLFPTLKRLRLRDHNMRTLSYRDIQMIRHQGWEVDMRSSVSWPEKLEAIEFTENDYSNVIQKKMDHNNAKIFINSNRHCDCRWYWFIRVLKARPGYISLPDANCSWYDPPGSENKKTAPIVDYPLDKLVCRIE